MHDDIKKFHLDGQVADSNLVEVKERLVHFVETSMRDEGYVPALDIEPQFTLDYQPEEEKYNFVLSVYGIWVGRENACEKIEGVMSGKMIQTYSPPIK